MKNSSHFLVGLFLIVSCTHSNIQNKIVEDIERFPAGEEETCVGAVRSLMGFQIDQKPIEVKRTLTNEVMEFIRLKLSSPKDGSEISVPKSVEQLNKFFFVYPHSQKVMDKNSLVLIKVPVITNSLEPMEPGIILRQGLYTNKGYPASTQWISIVFPGAFMDPYKIKTHLSTFIENIVEQTPNFNLSSIKKNVTSDGNTSYALFNVIDGKANVTSFSSTLSSKSEYTDQLSLDLAISPGDNVEDVLLLIEKIDTSLRFKYYIDRL